MIVTYYIYIFNHKEMVANVKDFIKVYKSYKGYFPEGSFYQIQIKMRARLMLKYYVKDGKSSVENLLKFYDSLVDIIKESRKIID